MFGPFNFLVLLVGAYLLLPVLGFGLFPEYFDFSSAIENFLILGAYIAVMLIAARTAMALEALGQKSTSAVSFSPLQEKWASRGSERRAFWILLTTTSIVTLAWMLIIFSADMLNNEFSPHAFRMGVATSGDLVLILTYNAFSLCTLIMTNLTLLSLEKARRKWLFVFILTIQISLVVITGQRSMIMLVLFSYLFLKSVGKNRLSAFKTTGVLLLGLAVTILLGVFRQGDDLNILAFIWQLSVRFDLFYPQFFNFLETYRNLSDIGYGYFHLTFPLQIIPSALLQEKPQTFLQFINRDLMNIAEGTGNDFTAFAEFIYEYGIVVGWLFYAVHCFLMTLIMQRIYRRARYQPLYFVLYFPCLLVYISLILLTGISNQAHLFSVAGIVAMILPCRLFMSYTKKRISARVPGEHFGMAPAASITLDRNDG